LLPSTARRGAIRCACAIAEAVKDLGLDIRAGLHTGECHLIDGKVAGIAVHTGARVAAMAARGEVLVSSTVKDLVAGSGLQFRDRGAFTNSKASPAHGTSTPSPNETASTWLRRHSGTLARRAV
jgi:class 3 adenylate cyclase